jgi:hypothetical protein
LAEVNGILMSELGNGTTFKANSGGRFDEVTFTPVDQKIPRSRQNSIGYAVGVNDSIKPIDKVELACIRQIAYELTVSILDRYPELVPEV